MEPLQLIAFESSNRASERLHDSLPGAPRVPYTRSRHQALAARTGLTARTHLAGLLRRTADRVDPCPAPSAG
jgi:hypothetical protein